MKRSTPTPPVFRPCPTCGREFKAYACNVKRGGGKYCSWKCRPYQGSGNPKWRGGRINEHGRTLVYAPGHPNAKAFGGTHIYEYRLVASRMLGRPLRDDEIVHHVNGDKNDNRPENLQVMTQAQHIREHGLPGHNRKAS